MKISKETIEILKSFSSINPSIFIKAGSTIRSLATSDTMLAIASVKENFPKDFAIYDINQFLGIISLLKEPEFDFQDKKVVISSGKTRIDYTYTEPSLVKKADYEKNIVIPSEDVEFNLVYEDFDKLLKAGRVLATSEFSFRNENDKLIASTFDKNVKNNNKSSIDYNYYSYEIGEADKQFNFILKKENLNILPFDYKVTLSFKGLACFKSEDVIYYIGADTSSSFPKE